MAAFPEAKFLLTISEPETWLSERFGGLSAGSFGYFMNFVPARKGVPNEFQKLRFLRGA